MTLLNTKIDVFYTLKLLVLFSGLLLSYTALGHGSIDMIRFNGAKLPETPGLLGKKSSIVIDQTAAIQLGKALFWDANVGSDGVACASCHFHAGADARTDNQLATGKFHLSSPDTMNRFEIGGQANYSLKSQDFPFFRFGDPANKNSQLLSFTDDVVGSSGAYDRILESIQLNGDGQDQCKPLENEIFQVDGLHTRQVTNRNAPTVINAAFNFRNFWDGRANNIFNGESAFGKRDPNARVWVKTGKSAKKVAVSLANASLASQAVAPPLDMLEMSCRGRTFHELGRKLLQRRPLEQQKVHAQDSVLGTLRHDSEYGLNTTYAELIKKAFADKYWSANGQFGTSPAGTPYSQMEANFAFFFGLAIQLYEDTLISDQAPIDRALDENGVPEGFTDSQTRGITVFFDAHCQNCHSGPTLTQAVNPAVFFKPSQKNAYVKLVDRTALNEQTSDFGVDFTLIDIGFADTSVVPNAYDIGLGGKDPFGHPLSFSEQYLAVLTGSAKNMLDPVRVLACEFVDSFVQDYGTSELVNDKLAKGACKKNKVLSKVPAINVAQAELNKPDQGRLSVNTVGAFKIPSLRNVELTGPYMHNGSMKSLEEVVEFYNRGGNGLNRRHSATLVFDQGFTEQNKADLLAFLKTMTDERVRWERAPFDHPELTIPHGHTAGESTLGAGLAEDQYLIVPAVGREGRSQLGLEPLQAFDRLLSE